MYTTNPFKNGKRFFNLQAEKLYRDACESFYIKNFAKALELLGEVIIHDKTHTKAFLLMGDIKLLEEGSEYEALEAYDKAIISDPTSTQAYGSKAYVLDILGRYEEAFENCEKAFEYFNKKDNDQLCSLYDQKISLLCSMRKFEEAGKVLAEAEKLLSEDNGNYLRSCYFQKIAMSKKEKQKTKQPNLKLLF